ncbi:MAG: hypothetical protein ACI9BW_004518 [Gammaproteobacteria bacterium]|jgi:hypothetical protein
MSSINFKIPPEFDSAPRSERIKFEDVLWARIANGPEAIAIPEHHRDILDERLGELNRNSDSGRPWPAVGEQMLAVVRKR